MNRLRMLGPSVATTKLGTARTLTVSGSQRVRGAELRRLQRLVAKRSRGLCECADCQRSGFPLPAAEFDHIVPLWEGGGDGLDNLQHLSVDCHKCKSAAEHRRRLGLDP